MYLRRLAVVFAGVALLLALVAARFAFVLYYDRSGLPDLTSFIDFEPPTTGAIYTADDHLLIEIAREYRDVVSYEEIPAVIRDATLAQEDRNFFTHAGVDYSAFPRVVLKNAAAIVATARKRATGGGFKVAFSQGGSTITQQLVRGYFLADVTRRENGDVVLSEKALPRLTAWFIGTPATNKLLRKVEEIRIALWLEGELRKRFGARRAKEMIFARYASFVYYGHGRYGVAAASKFYFNKPLASYTSDDADKAALLAAIVKNPNTYAPTPSNLERSLQRRNHTLVLMAKNGFLSDETAQRCLREPIQLAARHEEAPNDAPAVVSHVFDELERGVGGYGVDDLVLGRVRVHATVDIRIQHVADEALENGLRAYERRHPGSKGTIQGAVVVLANDDGRVLAEVGGRQVYRGRETRYTDFNRVTQSWRQPGSALKPLVYLAAFRQGRSLDTMVLDAPIDVPSTSELERKWIANYDNTYKGLITSRQALAESRNAATVWMAREIGIAEVIRTAKDLGISSPMRPYLSSALGASEVTLLELANAYRAVASGVLAEPHIIEKLTAANGARRYEARAGTRPALMSGLPLIQEGLRGVVRLPTGTARALNGRAFRIPVMGKTGTSNDFRDAVFVGSTYGPNGITVAVRIGHDDERPLGNKETGGKTALPVFREVMAKIYEQGLVGVPPPMPETIERGIDNYLNEEAMLVAWRNEPHFAEGDAGHWTVRGETVERIDDYQRPYDYRRPYAYRRPADYQQPRDYRHPDEYPRADDDRRTEDYRRPTDYQQPRDYWHPHEYPRADDYRRPAPPPPSREWPPAASTTAATVGAPPSGEWRNPSRAGPAWVCVDKPSGWACMKRR